MQYRGSMLESMRDFWNRHSQQDVDACCQELVSNASTGEELLAAAVFVVGWQVEDRGQGMNLREKLLARSVELYKQGGEALQAEAKNIGEAVMLLNNAGARK